MPTRLLERKNTAVNRTEPFSKDSKLPSGLWKAMSTPLSRYGEGRVRVLRMLERNAIAAEKQGKEYHVLDQGIGSGMQWLEFLQQHRNVRLVGTALSMQGVHPDIRKRVMLVPAKHMFGYFHSNTFDIIVSHYGMEGQELEGVGNIYHVLKPGGHAVIVSDRNIAWPTLTPHLIEVIKKEKNVLHFQKKK